jgi:hypothetical protein
MARKRPCKHTRHYSSGKKRVVNPNIKKRKKSYALLGLRYPTKKELKANIGKPLRFTETSMFGAEYKSDGDIFGVGPSPYDRKWYAQITMKDGKIHKVK